MGERRTIHYAGTVQGVGFRWTTLSALEGLAVAGYVRNLPDGRVQMVLEGPSTTLDEALARVRHALGDHIRSEDVQVGPASGEFQDFGIRR